jgi:hypothetical protein
MSSYLPLMERHFATLADTGLDRYGPKHTALWMSILDTRTGLPPDQPQPPRRVYRLIGAPRGSTLYWDQPLVVAAHLVSGLTGNPRPAQAADAYLDAFLENDGLDEHGQFQWGNHRYYDVYEDTVVRFHGGVHELRPITPAWELFSRLHAAATEHYIRQMVRRHLYDPATGGFNRHDDGKRGHAFIEAGAILVESLAWLHAHTRDPELLDTALRIARFSHSHRDPQTGLIANEPDHGRWDSKVSTTEVGLWAQSLLRAHAYTGRIEFLKMARDGVAAYLRHGYDAQSGLYWGQLDLATGRPVVAAEPGYWPREHADIWTTDQWPTHDYPMALAEAALTLFNETGDPLFREGVERWIRVVAAQPPPAAGTYAEHYGRCIHFLTRAGRELKDTGLVDRARRLAGVAIKQLEDERLVQGFPGTHLYESVDGVGFLFIALAGLETKEPLNLFGFGF